MFLAISFLDENQIMDKNVGARTESNKFQAGDAPHVLVIESSIEKWKQTWKTSAPDKTRQPNAPLGISDWPIPKQCDLQTLLKLANVIFKI